MCIRDRDDDDDGILSLSFRKVENLIQKSRKWKVYRVQKVNMKLNYIYLPYRETIRLLFNLNTVKCEGEVRETTPLANKSMETSAADDVQKKRNLIRSVSFVFVT